MPSSFRTTFSLVSAWLCIALWLAPALRAQIFSLETAAVQMVVTSNLGQDRQVSISSTDTSFRASALSVVNDSGGWLYSSLSYDGRTLLLSTGAADTPDTIATVTVRSATQEKKLKVRRLSVGPYIKPKILVSADKSTLYALYWNTLVAYDASTREVKNLARLPVVPDFNTAGLQGRVLKTNSDGSALEIFFSAVPKIARFHPETLTTLGGVELKDGAAAGTQRILAGERDGRIYLLRYGSDLDSANTYIYTYFETFVEVLDATDGTLLQSFSVPAHAGTRGNHFSVDDLALHPRRPELWARTQYETTGYADRSRLIRLRLDDAGLVESVADDGVSLTSVYYATRYWPWSDAMPRIRFTTQPGYAVTNTTILSDNADDVPDAIPGVLKTLDRPITHLTRTGAVAVCSPSFVLPEEGKIQELPALTKRFSGSTNYSVLGFSEDDRELVLSDSENSYRLPRLSVEPLAPLLADLPGFQLRSPSAGATISPTSDLTWRAQPGAERYRVYLADSAAALAPAEPASEFLIGEVSEAALHLSAPLAAGRTYFWRVDSVSGARTLIGQVQLFGVSTARIDGLPLKVETVASARRRDVAFPVLTSVPEIAWNLVSDTPWVSVRKGGGVGSGEAEISIDALTLSPGTHSATLGLVTTEGSVPVSLSVTVQSPYIYTMEMMRGSGRLIAVGPGTYGTTTTGRFLLSIDTATEQIALCRHVPVSEFSFDRDNPALSVTDSASPVYAITGNRIGEFDPDTLAFKRSFTLPSVLGEYGYPTPREVRATTNGRVWVSDSTNRFLRYDPVSSRYDLVVNSRPYGALSVLSEDFSTVFSYDPAYTSDPIYPSVQKVTAFTLRSLARSENALTQTSETSFPVSPVVSEAYYESTPPLRSLHPFRFVARGVVCDESLNRLCDLEDTIVASAADGSAMVGRSLIYLGDNYQDARILPEYHPAKRRYYDAVTRKLIVYDDGLKFTAVDSLPLVTPVAIRLDRAVDIYADFIWVQPPNHGPTPSYDFNYTFSYRLAGSDDKWQVARAYNFSYSSPVRLQGLLPDKTYEVRLRAQSSGALSRWSEPVTVTTAVARPTYAAADWPRAQAMKEGTSVALSLPVTGQSLVWEVGGLPPGLVFDEATRTISGTVELPGRYTVTLKVSNPGGSFEYTISFRVAALSLDRNFSRYSGLQEFKEDPLVGDWRVARSGEKFTGSVRTFAGSGSFSLKIPRVGDSSYSDIRTGVFRTRIDGVRVSGSLYWDTLTDQCQVWLSVYEYNSKPLPETGLGVSYDKASPHPFTARYTALSMEDPETPSEYQVPDGAGFLRLDLAADGGVTVAAETSLGQRFTTSTSISRDGIIPLFIPHNGYHVWGLLQIDRSLELPTPRLAGSLGWTKYTNRKSSFYRDGFEQQLLVLGAPLPATGKTLPPLAPLANPASRADFALTGGGLGRLSKPIAQTLTPAAAGFTAPKPGTPENPHRVSVKLDAKTGLVTGSAAILDANAKKVLRTQSFRGMFVKDPLGDGQDVIGGYFLLPDGTGAKQSGLVEITEPEPEPAP